MATGDGTILSAGARSGYGNRVEIQHANGYTSAYNHMARIARGVAPGARVRSGKSLAASAPPACRPGRTSTTR